MLNTFFNRLQHHAVAQPNQVALRDNQGQLTYAELYQQVELLADFYQCQGQRRFALDLPNSIRWVVHDLALLLSGCVSVPIPPFFSEVQRRHLLDDSGVRAIITSTEILELSRSDVAAAEVPELPVGTQKITYTSGSTGTAKGVCLSVANMFTTVFALAERIGELKVQRHLVVMPLAVLLENVAGVYLSLWLGHEVIVVASDSIGLKGSSSLDYLMFCETINYYQPHSLILTPALAQVLVMAAEQKLIEPSYLKLIAVGGARLSNQIEQRARLLKLPLVPGYGLSECASVVAFNHPHHVVVGTVGLPLSHARVTLVDGEIVIAGNIMLGYLHDPTSWYLEQFATGDLGEFDNAGNLRILGRKKNIIVTAWGRNVDPEWVEAELMLQPQVAQAAVIGNENLPLTALIAATNGLNLSAQQLNSVILAVNQGLPDYAQIQRWFLVDEGFRVQNQQLTGTGRLRREAIAQAYANLLTN